MGRACCGLIAFLFPLSSFLMHLWASSLERECLTHLTVRLVGVVFIILVIALQGIAKILWLIFINTY